MSTYLPFAALTLVVATTVLSPLAQAQGGVGPSKLTGASLILVDSGAKRMPAPVLEAMEFGKPAPLPPLGIKGLEKAAELATPIVYIYTIELNQTPTSQVVVGVTDTLGCLSHVSTVTFESGQRTRNFSVVGYDAPLSGYLTVSNAYGTVNKVVETQFEI